MSLIYTSGSEDAVMRSASGIGSIIDELVATIERLDSVIEEKAKIIAELQNEIEVLKEEKEAK